ncbi:MAG: sulfite exporter TauE/SafE family protein [Microscillaceae bacterium]|nr:sulfite exporter TauE/SafE family protein [Microscillaceae bacterium]MDW8460066.1 sulfite exporter TauE/SafE family protein [Cytophagales bacterium]
MQEAIGYILASLIGISLGLIGGGGSILTVPVLVYVMGISTTLSTAYSLFIVGTTALVGSLNYMQRQLVCFRTAIIFSIPSFISVFLVRKYLVPIIPEKIMQLGSFTLTRDIFLMLLLAILMLFAALSMIKDKKKIEVLGQQETGKFNYLLISVEGFVVGAITGLVGAGGGFMIIPALVLFAKLDMKLAVGTSLIIITIKSLIGFLGDVANPNLTIDWMFLILFSTIASAGIFIGAYLSRFIESEKLKKAFGVFIILMAIYILVKELLLK